MKSTIKKLEKAVRERKLTAREAEVELLEKFDMFDLIEIIPCRKIKVVDFDHKHFYMENGECVSGDFPFSGKIHDNVEFCKDTQRFEYIEYFYEEDE